VAVSNCTFSGNSVYFDSYPAYGAGGAIYNGQGATLTVNSSRFHANRAFHGMGGAIHNAGGTVTVTDSEFANNGDAEDGGAVSNYGGLVTVSRSTFADNRAFRNGGGIANIRGTVAVSDSTFFGNLTRFWSSSTGGGIYNRGVMYVSNSTFVGNQSSYGGGVSTFDGTLLVSNSTFAANRAASGGGGVYFWADNRAAVLKNTIVANSLEGGNCYGPITDGGGNLSYPDTTCPGINADPLLGPLQDNGGPTWTMALGEGSAALDAADDAICAAPPVNNLDQRGFPRPWGAHCDIGAVEQVQEPVAVRLSTINAGSTPGAVAPAAVAGLLLLALGGCAAWGRRQTQQVG
jgi:hypothetical protein